LILLDFKDFAMIVEIVKLLKETWISAFVTLVMEGINVNSFLALE
jgi:hypothetical protein